MTTEPKRALIVFLRLPVPGKVKTRLAASIGKDAACSFYKTTTEHILQEVGKTPNTSLHVFYSDEADEDGVICWISSLVLSTLEIRLQVQDPDLGARMTAAFTSVLDAGVQKAVIIGTDIPDLTHNIIDSAYEALDHSDVVLGPAVDGGYYLIGLRRIHKDLLKGIRWSTPDVYTSTVANADSLGLSVTPKATLPILQDIDELKDLVAWEQQCTTDIHPVLKVSRDVMRSHGV